MNGDTDYRELVTKAKLGQRESLDTLARLAERRLRAYLYRVTLDRELSEDLLQDALMQMVESVKTLRNVECFWPWLFRIATSKIQQHFREQQQRKMIEFSTLEDNLLSQCLVDETVQAGADSAVRRELGRLVVKAMEQLKQPQRATVALRCFEQMSYAQVAQSMSCSESRARVLFFRAKRSLKRTLSSQGFSKSSLPLAIGLFGAVTAPSDAAAATTIAFGGEIAADAGFWSAIMSILKRQPAEAAQTVHTQVESEYYT